MFTTDWSYNSLYNSFKTIGCSVSGCSFYKPQGCAAAGLFCCALNLSDTIIKSGYVLPEADGVNLCDHSGGSQKRVRNADGMARVCMKQNNNKVDATTWANRPSWKGIVYFEGGLLLWKEQQLFLQNLQAGNLSNFIKEDLFNFLVTGHIDLWDGTKGVHAQYPDSNTVWFWKLGA